MITFSGMLSKSCSHKKMYSWTGSTPRQKAMSFWTYEYIRLTYTCMKWKCYAIHITRREFPWERRQTPSFYAQQGSCPGETGAHFKPRAHACRQHKWTALEINLFESSPPTSSSDPNWANAGYDTPTHTPMLTRSLNTGKISRPPPFLRPVTP